MIATDMMEYIESDLTIFGLAVAIIFALMLYLFFGSIWLVILPLVNAFLATFITAGFLGFMDWKISVVSSNFIALLLILTISLTVHLLVKINELKEKHDAILIAKGKVQNIDMVVGAQDFRFIGGSFGAASGEAFIAGAQHAVSYTHLTLPTSDLV